MWYLLCFYNRVTTFGWQNLIVRDEFDENDLPNILASLLLSTIKFLFTCLIFLIKLFQASRVEERSEMWIVIILRKTSIWVWALCLCLHSPVEEPYLKCFSFWCSNWPRRNAMFQSIYLPICLSIYLYIYLSIYLHVCLHIWKYLLKTIA